MTIPADQELVAVQRLYFRLLYCQRTVESYDLDPDAILRAAGLATSWRAQLPNTASKGHRAEMHGRRALVAQDLAVVYRATLDRLHPPEASTPAILAASWFSEFLSSPHFFDPAWSLPHPNGVGRAYEGHSRFFFWARDAFGLRRGDAVVALRDDLYLDFAAHLDQAQVHAVEPVWAKFRHGFFWLSVPGTDGPCRGLNKDREVFTLRQAEAAKYLSAQRLSDLDRLHH